MGHLRDQMETDLKLAGYSPSTRGIYLLYAGLFAKHFKRSPAELGRDEVRAYLLYLIEQRQASRETIRQVRAALNFLYSTTLRRCIEVDGIPVIRQVHRLPSVLSGSEVATLLQSTTSPKYRALFMTLYGAGLRISEACHLKVQDIDSKRMLIRVVAGKGGRDRYAMLSVRLLAQLRRYWSARRPQPWLFPNQSQVAPLSPDAARKVFRQVLSASGITKPVTPHSLRHCFATHLLECGTDIKVIQSLLGHGHLRATEVYTHVSIEHIARVRSPLDLLDTPDGKVLG